MLTKQEFNQIKEDMKNDHYSREAILGNLQARYVEKRKVQAGDIYRDGSGEFVKIIGVDELDVMYPLKTRHTTYTLDGKYYLGRDDSKYNLDLTKRYKLVEIEE